MLGFSSPLRAEPKNSAADRSEKGFSSPFRPSRTPRDRRRPTRFSFETLEPRIAMSAVSGMVQVFEVASEPDEPEPGPGPDGEPPVDVPPPPFGPLLPARTER